MNHYQSPLETLFDTSDFPARWHCGRWTDLHGWMHISSDLAIAGAYAAIPVVLVSFIRRRGDTPFVPVFFLFAAFILTCGIGHFIEATIFWHPWYRLSAAMKATTAVVSWATVFVLIRVLPEALELPGLVRVNAQLKKEMDDRQQTENELKESQERFELAVAGSNDGIWDWNIVTGADYFSNRWCELLGYQPGSIQAHVTSWSSLLHPDDKERVERAVKRHLEERVPYNEEMRLKNADGSYRWYQARGQAVWDDEGTPLRMAGSLSDITARQEAQAERESLLQQLQEANRKLELQIKEKEALNASLEAQVEQRTRSLNEARKAAENSNRAKGRFLANMSHEIRTPMNAVLGLLQLLQRTQLSTVQADYASQAETAGSNLMGVLNDILDLSKIEAGKLTLSHTPFSPRSVFCELAALPPAILGDRDVDVVFDLDPQLPPTFVGDPLRLRQILLNLLSNAIKFTEAGQVVLRVTGERKGDSFALDASVSDTGSGISDESLRRIFLPFEQAEADTTRKHGGTGLGLAITSELVHMMGGRISAESQIGEGSCFQVKLELPIPQDAQPEAPSAKLVAFVAIAEKGVQALKMHARYATAFSERVVVAREGDNLHDLLQNAPLPPKESLLLLDAALASVSLLESLRAAFPHIEIVLTARKHMSAEDPLAPYCRRSIVKPLTPMRLEHVVRSTAKPHPSSNSSSQSIFTRQPLEGFHILVVDDVETNLLVAQQILQSAGARVSTASGGAKAISMADEAGNKFDLILMDIQMPDIDGFAATREIREKTSYGNRPVIALSADALESAVEASRAAGMNGHISKPFSATGLIETVAHWVQNPLDSSSEDAEGA